MIVKYTRDDLDYMVMVPDGTAQEFWQYGAVLGPPDLSSLKLVAADFKKLHNGLVAKGVFDGQTLDRRVVRQLLNELHLDLDERWITSLYINEYF